MTTSPRRRRTVGRTTRTSRMSRDRSKTGWSRSTTRRRGRVGEWILEPLPQSAGGSAGGLTAASSNFHFCGRSSTAQSIRRDAAGSNQQATPAVGRATGDFSGRGRLERGRSARPERLTGRSGFGSARPRGCRARPASRRRHSRRPCRRSSSSATASDAHRRRTSRRTRSSLSRRCRQGQASTG
jgi:hypothetical protein